MSQPLKLKLNTQTFNRASPINTPSAATPATPGGLITPGGGKLKLKFRNPGASRPASPAPAPSPAPIPLTNDDLKPKKTKAGRATKPSAKILESRKRVKEESDSEGDDGVETIKVQQPAAKKLKLTMSKASHPPPVRTTPITPGFAVKLKQKGKIPKRPLGEGYDSEASDRELDPVIEEQFVLRMMPGEDCEYLRQAINDKKIGIPRGQPGWVDISMKFYHADGRRAAVIIKGTVYAATLVDLPCVIEGMKSWDKRGWWKSADICQMLWVFAQVRDEAEAKEIPLPSIIDPHTHQYPHGLTAPMHFARKRRFRKRIHKSQIEAVEDAVERLLKADAEAASSKYEIIDPDAEARRPSEPWTPEASPGGEDYGTAGQYSEDEDAEGELDDQGGYFENDHHPRQYQQDGEESVMRDEDDDLENELEAALEAGLFDEAEPEPGSGAATPISTAVATPSQLATSTPAGEPSGVDEEDSGDESFESDEDDDEGADEIDPEKQARDAMIAGTREEIALLEANYEQMKSNLSLATNPLIKRRLEDKMKANRIDLQMKKTSIGEDD